MTGNSEYLFELLSEEIPAWMLGPRLDTLRGELTELLRTSFGEVGVESVFVDATSRRISVRLTSLPSQQEDRVEEVKGPPRKISFDADGSPSKALAGFLKKNDSTPDDILPGEDEYVRIRRSVRGRRTADILSEAIPRIVGALRWPKMMRWGAGELSYIRPVHSIISLLDGAPLPISMFGIASGNATVGHRTLSPGGIEVDSFEDYDAKLRAAHVVIRSEERVETMRERARMLGGEVSGTPARDESIWEQWRYLTEAPALVRAEFRAEYLSLPEEVLVTVMRVHQKQLPIVAKGKLTNSFLAVIDNTGDPDGNAASGNAFVTNARFADAKFFYETDRRRPLESRLDELTRLQFHEKLGDYRKKSERIERIAVAVASLIGADAGAAGLAARVAKTDLVTEMVKEFTDLQGKIGGIYAREEGLAEPVWQAVYDQYLPANIEDPLPRGNVGAIVSLADRIDTLCGFFSLGLRPTGSKDPFALRRAAQGAVLILINRAGWQLKIGLDAVIDIAIEAYGIAAAQAATVKLDLLDFFAERVKTILEASPFNFAYDEIAACMEPGWAGSLTDLHDRLEALRSIRDRADFLSLLDSSKRIANITAGSEARAVRVADLADPAETRLYELAALVAGQIDELVAARRYSDALESFAAMAPELEVFFNKVMVMVEDESIRSNRIALLQHVGSLARRIADVTKIVVDRKDYTG